MKKWLEKIRSKSEVEKRSFAIMASFLITLFIGLIYVVSLTAQNSTSEVNMASPFSAIIEVFKGVIENNKF